MMSKYKVKALVHIEETAWVDFHVEANSEEEAIEKASNWDGEEVDEYGNEYLGRSLISEDVWEVNKITPIRYMVTAGPYIRIFEQTGDQNIVIAAIEDDEVYDVIDGHKIALNDSEGVFKLKVTPDAEIHSMEHKGWKLNEEGNIERC